jgi:hypothetical protein
MSHRAVRELHALGLATSGGLTGSIDGRRITMRSNEIASVIRAKEAMRRNSCIEIELECWSYRSRRQTDWVV